MTYREGTFYVAENGQPFLMEQPHRKRVPLQTGQRIDIWLGVWIEGHFMEEKNRRGMMFIYDPPQLSEEMSRHGALCGMVGGMKIRLLLERE